MFHLCRHAKRCRAIHIIRRWWRTSGQCTFAHCKGKTTLRQVSNWLVTENLQTMKLFPLVLASSAHAFFGIPQYTGIGVGEVNGPDTHRQGCHFLLNVFSSLNWTTMNPTSKPLKRLQHFTHWSKMFRLRKGWRRVFRWCEFGLLREVGLQLNVEQVQVGRPTVEVHGGTEETKTPKGTEKGQEAKKGEANMLDGRADYVWRVSEDEGQVSQAVQRHVQGTVQAKMREPAQVMRWVQGYFDQCLWEGQKSQNGVQKNVQAAKVAKEETTKLL